VRQAGRDTGDRVGMDGAEMRTSVGKTLSNGKTASLKPKAGLNGALGDVLPRVRLL
jgi:hypothetical protein